jgi:hypothetical protein
MNPYMASFFSLGVIYSFIGVWAMASGFMTSLGISVVGMALCAAGWKFSQRYLQ